MDKQQVIIAAGIVVDKQNHVLLLKRSDAVKRAPGKWELPSSKVLYGEEPLASLQRAVSDNLGLEKSAVGKLIDSQSFISSNQQKHVIIYYNKVEVEGTSPDVKLPDDYTQTEWVNIENLQQYEVESRSLAAINKLKTHLVEGQAINKIVDKNATYDMLEIYTDGGSRGNPGPSASGFVILNDKGEVIEEGGEYIGVTTNNQAEYQAVKYALMAAKKYQPKTIKFKIDSMLVVKQMNGEYKIRSKDLWPIHEDIKKLSAGINVSYSHVYREYNELADGKVNEILDSRN